MILNIDTNEVIKYTNTLEKLHRSALPNAIRGALNKAAFDVKQRTMPASAQKEFVNRQPNFFKANSRVDMAKGWSIESMQATVGFIESGLKGGSNNHAVDDLEQQERGGVIGGRSFIPTNTARGGSGVRPVRPGNRLTNIKKIVNANKFKGTEKQKFNQAALEAGEGGFVIGTKAKKILWRIDSIKDGRTVLKIKPIYSFEDKRKVKVKGTGFMQTASLSSGSRIEEFYIAEATRQVERLMK